MLMSEAYDMPELVSCSQNVVRFDSASYFIITSDISRVASHSVSTCAPIPVPIAYSRSPLIIERDSESLGLDRSIAQAFIGIRVTSGICLEREARLLHCWSPLGDASFDHGADCLQYGFALVAVPDHVLIAERVERPRSFVASWSWIGLLHAKPSAVYVGVVGVLLILRVGDIYCHSQGDHEREENQNSHICLCRDR